MKMMPPPPSRLLMTAAAVCIVLLGAGKLGAQDKGPTTRPAPAPRTPTTLPAPVPKTITTLPAPAPKIIATPPALVVRTPTTRPASAPKTVSNVFVDTDLREALSDVASELEVVIIPDSSVSGVVTCELKDASVDRALEILLAGTDFVVKKTPNYYLVCSGAPDSPSFVLISKTVVIKPNYVKASDAVKLLSEAFQKVVKADPLSNTLCITAAPAMMERIITDLKLIDRPPRHVMLSARIVVMDRTDLENIGVEWGWPTIAAGVFTSSDNHGGGGLSPDWPWGVQIGYTPGKEFTNSLMLTLNLLGQNDEATVIAAPQLMAQDGKPAEINVATEEYFQIESEGVYARSQLEKIDTGTILKIIPSIGEKGSITLDISTEVSGVIARGEDNLPVVTRRTAKSTVRIENGGTAAIAGLMDTRSQSNRSSVPGISKLPLIGWFFQNDSDAKLSRQIAIFITARLMTGEQGDPEEAPPRRKPIKPLGKEFKKALRESLRSLRQKGGEQ